MGGRFSSETAPFVNALAKAKSESAPQELRGRVRGSLQTTLGGDTGVQCSPVLRHVPLPACGTGMDPPSVHEVVRDSRLMRVWGGAQTRLGAHLL